MTVSHAAERAAIHSSGVGSIGAVGLPGRRLIGCTITQLSSLDFLNLDEQRFWSEHAHLCRRFAGERLERYREIFDEYLAGRVSICL